MRCVRNWPVALGLFATGACLPPAAPWPAVEASDADADADADVDADADADADTGEPLQCWSLYVGGTAWVSVPPNTVARTELYTDTRFTIEAWAWFEGEVAFGTHTLVGLGDAWWLGMEDGAVVFRSGPDELSSTVELNGWHHVGAVVDQSDRQIRLYIDGERSAQVNAPEPMTQPAAGQHLTIGSAQGDAASWPHSIDEVRFGHGAFLAGTAPEYGADRPIDDWIGVWRFNNDLVNAVTGVSALGENLTYSDSCP